MTALSQEVGSLRRIIVVANLSIRQIESYQYALQPETPAPECNLKVF